jgi:multiple sugar transport system ATP-binding protein
MAEIRLDSVSKVFSNGVVAFDDVTLEIAEGEFLVLVGPSGCGKSTLLRLIAGLEDVSYGSISIGGRDVTDLSPKDRDIAMVFQSYALYPHMTVRQNLGYGLRVRRTPKEEAGRRVEEVAALLGLEEMLDRRPAQLSGGQRQRVAMGRAIVREPKAFLMDEPLSNLDAKLRVSMRASLAQLHGRLGVTTVYVTHDQVEAMTLGQRVAVVRDGRILQVADPHTLYQDPASLFVAAFIGSPAMNLVEATLRDGVVHFGQYRVPLPRDRRPAGSDARIVLGIRPEAFADAAFAASGRPTIEARVDVLEDVGADAYVHFPVSAPQLTAESLERSDDQATILVESSSLFTARVDPRSSARPGSSIVLAIDPERFHFFDAQSGASLLRRADSASGEASESGLDHAVRLEPVVP